MKYNKNDYIKESLPKTRFELFIDIFKNQTRTLIVLALIVFLITLPLIIFHYYDKIIIDRIIASENYSVNDIKTATIYNSLIFIGVMLLVSIFLAGIAKIYKKLTYNEGFVLAYTFSKSLKENIKDYLIIGLIYGILSFVIKYIGISFISTNTMIYYLFILINYLVLTPITIVVFIVCSIYSDKIIKKIFVSIMLFFKYLHIVFAAYLILVLPLFALLFNNLFLHTIYLMLYALFYLPFALIIFELFIHYCLDKLINQTSFPDIYRKGLVS